MEFLANYSLFLLKLVSAVAGTLLLVAGIIALASRAKEKRQGKLIVQNLNEKYETYQQELTVIVDSKDQVKKYLKSQKKLQKKNKKNAGHEKRIFVIHFNGDIRASAVAALREEITALLTIANKKDEVLVCLESGGGLVNAYGLAASQLLRIRSANIKLTIAIDKIAASGGYLMACTASDIIAAPFAVIGSIGVITQLPNFHRYLQKKSIDFEQITAGEYKRTLTLFGENTEKGREKLQEEVNHIHRLFTGFIEEHRPQIDIKKVATGEHWYGTDAINLKLVDRLQTSDDYLLQQSEHSAIFAVSFQFKKPLSKRLTQGVSSLLQRLMGVNQAGQDYIA